ncbi:hypothetical protein PoB_004281600 [Plakobranchus ocellatus]|uniref:Reverse transcriptase domain-containing protein n=1 Tax=Plakobranchus ocellatus TaxID=259542 RepID=A0AAV4B788_9GAST|nr:hypothetical protein PoB_004281600 [Plakobranchus ocellatus]
MCGNGYRGQWNIRSLRSSFKELKLLLNRSQSAVVVLQEYRLGERQSPPRGYTLLLSQGGSSGGEAALLIRNGTRFSEIVLNTGLHVAAATISLQKTLTVCSLCLPPNTPVSKLSLAEFFEQLPKPFLVLRFQRVLSCVGEEGGLRKLFNNIWTTWDISRSWREALVVPIPKPGKGISDPSNYKPTALTSCLYQTLERMVNDQLVHVLESRNLLSRVQCGFRKYHSTLVRTIRKRQATFLGHVMRRGKLEHLVTTGKFEGKRSRGRQGEKIMDRLATWLGPGKVSDILAAVKDRDLWRDMIANAYKQGT